MVRKAVYQNPSLDVTEFEGASVICDSFVSGSSTTNDFILDETYQPDME